MSHWNRPEYKARYRQYHENLLTEDRMNRWNHARERAGKSPITREAALGLMWGPQDQRREIVTEWAELAWLTKEDLAEAEKEQERLGLKPLYPPRRLVNGKWEKL